MKYRTESTFDNITTNFTFINVTITKVENSETWTNNISQIRAASSSLNNDAAKSYKVTVNIFSTDVQTFNGTVNSTTALGPIGFDCYDTITPASSADFTVNQLTFAQSGGSSLPSWLTFDNATANVSISNPSEVSNDTYTITNTYTGVLGSTFTLQNNAIISLAEEVVTNTTTNTTTTNNENNDDDDYCLNASSKGLCGFFIFLIIGGVIILFSIIGTVLYCKLKKPKNLNKNDMTRVNQYETNEPDNDPAADQQNDVPNLETMGMHRTTHPQDNQV